GRPLGSGLRAQDEQAPDVLTAPGPGLDAPDQRREAAGWVRHGPFFTPPVLAVPAGKGPGTPAPGRKLPRSSSNQAETGPRPGRVAGVLAAGRHPGHGLSGSPDRMGAVQRLPAAALRAV